MKTYGFTDKQINEGLLELLYKHLGLKVEMNMFDDGYVVIDESTDETLGVVSFSGLNEYFGNSASPKK